MHYLLLNGGSCLWIDCQKEGRSFIWLESWRNDEVFACFKLEKLHDFPSIDVGIIFSNETGISEEWGGEFFTLVL